MYYSHFGNTRIQEKISTCVKYMFKTTYVEHMFNMCETYVKIHKCLTCIFFICLIHVKHVCKIYVKHVFY